MAPIEPMLVITLAGWTLIASAILIARLPVGNCEQCDHCRAAKARESFEESRERETDLRKMYGVTRCLRCGQFHRTDRPC